MRKSLSSLVFCLTAVASFTACSKQADFTADSQQAEQETKQTYATKFVEKYGPIANNQSWDFTTGERLLATRGATTVSAQIMEKGIDWGDLSNLKTERVTFNGHPEWDYDVIKGGVEKNAELLNAISTVLPEKKKWNGKPAVLVAPASSFYIYPLFSGGNLRFDLQVKIGNEIFTVFQKDYKNFQTINGMKKENGEIVNMRGIKIEAPVGTPIEVYLDNRTELNGNKLTEVAGTTNGRAVYVDIPEGIIPEIEGVELKENAIVKYIGIEDVTTSGSDNDYNDLVLAVIGNPDIPQEKIITNDEYEVKTCVSKRYMIEDLGATDDFDFNDVVVDVEKYTTTKHKVTRVNGVITSDEITKEEGTGCKAIIRAMGGTIDFTLKVGDTPWSKSQNGFDVKTMYNTAKGNIDYNAELAVFDVTGWDYDANNVSIEAKEKSGAVFNIAFPKKGTVPMIIAFDTTQEWMTERTSIPKSWFTNE